MTIYRKVLLFILFFLFQWSGQFFAAAASRSNSPFSLYLIPMYCCLFIRGGIWLYLLNEMRLGLAYSLSSIGYLVIPLLSYLILGERIQIKHLSGGALILAGITLYGIAEQRRREKTRRCSE